VGFFIIVYSCLWIYQVSYCLFDFYAINFTIPEIRQKYSCAFVIKNLKHVLKMYRKTSHLKFNHFICMSVMGGCLFMIMAICGMYFWIMNFLTDPREEFFKRRFGKFHDDSIHKIVHKKIQLVQELACHYFNYNWIWRTKYLCFKITKIRNCYDSGLWNGWTCRFKYYVWNQTLMRE